MKKITAPILGFFPHREAFKMGLPFELDDGEKIYLKFGDNCYAEFEKDIVCNAATFQNEWQTIGKTCCRPVVFTRTVTEEECQDGLLLCPVNAPLAHFLVEVTHFSKLFSNTVDDLLEKALVAMHHRRFENFSKPTLLS